MPPHVSRSPSSTTAIGDDLRAFRNECLAGRYVRRRGSSVRPPGRGEQHDAGAHAGECRWQPLSFEALGEHAALDVGVYAVRRVVRPAAAEDQHEITRAADHTVDGDDEAA